MSCRSQLARSMALAVLLLAGSEIVFCAQCSPESCIFSHTDHQKTPSSGSCNDCFCCCTHFLVRQPLNIAPIAVMALAPPSAVPGLQIMASAVIDHPPQI